MRVTPVTPAGGFADDLCLSFFGRCYAEGMFQFPDGARVLEVGCAEADWSTPMKALRPDLHITSVDVRPCKRPGSDVMIQGDARDETHFPPGIFDAIVSVSTIEHVGLGFYGDPLDPDGDTRAMANLLRWVRPDGWLYCDVPYRPTYSVRGTKFRMYNDAALQTRLLAGWQERARMVIEVDHPDGPFIALTVTPA